MLTLEELRKDEDIRILIEKADHYLDNIGYTDHGSNHVETVASRCRMMGEKLMFSPDEIEIVSIAGYLHDIGNISGRKLHSIVGSIMAFQLLREKYMEMEAVTRIVTAIANHDEYSGTVTDKYSAVLIIADKSDVRRTRVRSKEAIDFDIHDRVNYAVRHSELMVIQATKEIWLNLSIDTQVSNVMDYFEIFLKRMLMCKEATKKLDHIFHLKINDSILY
jgi:uncharacterized protein